MHENTLYAYDLFYKTKERIDKGEIPESELQSLFLKLSKLDYRTEGEKKIDIYLEQFKGFRSEEYFNDVCENLSREKFKKVQEGFWKRYKDAYASRPEGSFMITPVAILNKVKYFEKKRRMDQ
jgi:hypothetical protein